MTDVSDSRRILDLLAQGKITVDEADQLLRATGANAARANASCGRILLVGCKRDQAVAEMAA